MKPSFVVSAALLEQDELLFCARRAPHKSLAGYWEFPGGKVEPNESGRECLERELTEEFNIETKALDFFMKTTYDYSDQSITLLAYFVRWVSGEMMLVDHDRALWLPRSRLNSLKWSPADIPIVRALSSHSPK